VADTIHEKIRMEGLDCPSCASKIESKLSRLDGVNLASVNIAAGTLTLDADASVRRETLIEKARHIIDQTEPGVKIFPDGERQQVSLEHLGCADCAEKIEKRVARLPGVEGVQLNFSTRKLSYRIQDADQADMVVEDIRRIVGEIEPEVQVRTSEHKGAGESSDSLKKKIIAFTTAAALFVGGLFYREYPMLFVLSYLIAGFPVLKAAGRNLLHGQVFDENFLMSIATIGAFLIGDYAEAGAVMLFYQAGEFFQDLAVDRSRKSIASLMDIRPDHVNIRREEGLVRANPQDARPGDVMVIKPGERIALDGRVIEGNSVIDTSALTGESLPREVGRDSEILSGSVNTHGVISAEVTKSYGDSTVSRILQLVEDASGRKAKTENFITKFARYYTPAVVAAAALLALVPPLLIEGALFETWIHRALIFLVVSCPCALVISIPLGFFGGIGRASRQGILIKGSNYLEALNQVDTIVLDKTGTLTEGKFSVSAVEPARGVTKENLLYYAAAAEFYSTHPIADSLRNTSGQHVSAESIHEYQEFSGYGVKAKIDGLEITAGNKKLMEKIGITDVVQASGSTVVHVAADNDYLGAIEISDTIKADSRQAVERLKALGIPHIYMLTGDSQTAADHIASQIGVDRVFAQLLPDDKVSIVEELSRENGKGKLMFVGDGINDAPVLARSDVGVAMGGLGSDAAIEAADVVLMTDEPSKIAQAIITARRTRTIVWQNIVFALGVKAIVLLLGAAGLATMWAAVFADVGVALIAVMNALRILSSRR
jgi:Cd2+/Zn2+-exporting ATPase